MPPLPRQHWAAILVAQKVAGHMNAAMDLTEGQNVKSQNDIAAVRLEKKLVIEMRPHLVVNI